MNTAPKNLKSLLQLSQVDQKPWRKAMESEIQSLQDRGTFEVIQKCDLTEQLLDTTWVFTTKEHSLSLPRPSPGGLVRLAPSGHLRDGGSSGQGVVRS